MGHGFKFHSVIVRVTVNRTALTISANLLRKRFDESSNVRNILLYIVFDFMVNFLQSVTVRLLKI